MTALPRSKVPAHGPGDPNIGINDNRRYSFGWSIFGGICEEITDLDEQFSSKQHILNIFEFL